MIGQVSDLDQNYDGGSANAWLGFAYVGVVLMILVGFILNVIPVRDSLALRALTPLGAGALLAWFAISKGITTSWAIRTNRRLRTWFALCVVVSHVLALGGTLLALLWGLANGNVEVVTNAGLFLAGLLAGITAAVAYHTQRAAAMRWMQLVSLRRQRGILSNRPSREEFKSHLPSTSNPPPRPESTPAA